MSPEQISEQSIDQRSDIFSLGILLYQMLSGKRPFAGNNVSEIRKQFAEGNYMPIGKLLPHLPPKLSEIVDQCLAIDINKRWQTSTELSEHLTHLYRALTTKKNWWQKQHWLSKAALVLPVVMVIGWSIKEVVFPPSTNELIARQVAEANKIALLPFDNISGDPLLQLFSDGLLVTLSNDLTTAGLEQGDGNTWVIPSSEIRRVPDLSVRAVADKFGVDMVLTGSVQHMGSTRNIVLNLINAKDGRQLKSAELTVDASKLFQAHQSVRMAAMKLLEWKVPPALTKKSDRQSSQFDGAYKEYIQGTGYLYRHDQAGNLQKALDAFKKAIDIDPGYQLAYISLAETQLVNFRKTKNNVWLTEMEKTIASLDGIKPSHSLVDYLWAELLSIQGQYQKAILLFTNSIEKEPKHIQSYIGLANAYDRAGEVEKAERAFQAAVALSPNNVTTIIEFGMFYFRNGNYAKAIKQSQLLAKMTPNNDYAYLHMAANYYSMGEIDNAIKNTQLAIKIQPTDSAYSNLATMFYYNKDYDAAVSAYEKAVELNATYYVFWGNLGDAYTLTKSDKREEAYRKAVAFALEALSVNENDNAVVADLSYYFANLNERKQALKYAQKISEKSTGMDHFMVATAYEILGETEQALAQLAYAIDKNYSIDEILSTPLLEKTRADKRFKQLLEEKLLTSTSE